MGQRYELIDTSTSSVTNGELRMENYFFLIYETIRFP